MYGVFLYEDLDHDIELLRNLGAENYLKSCLIQRRRFLK